MGRKKAELSTSDFSSSCMSDALLFTTMCMIGLPVHVQAKDGSIFSGIFHTASFQNDHGIVLKRAKMEKKGKHNPNLAEGALVDTLVIFSDDIVQVVAKGVMVPVDGIVGNVAGDDTETAMGTTHPQVGHPELDKESKEMISGKVANKRFATEDVTQIDHTRKLEDNTENNSSLGLTKTNSDDDILRKEPVKPSEVMVGVENGKMESVCVAKTKEASAVQVVSSVDRQAGKSKPQLEEDANSDRKDCSITHEVPSSSSPDAAECTKLVSPLIMSEALGSVVTPSTTVQSLDGPSNTSSVVDIMSASSSSSSTSPAGSVPSKSSVSSTNTKEFKLNPGAKTFSPSFANSKSAPPASSINGNIGYVPSNVPVVPVASVQPGVEISPFVPRPSLPVKIVQYSNLVSANSGSGSQYSLPIVGHMGGRQQPMRYGSQIQSGPAYGHPSSQTVMVGRLGQVVYVHPIPHDAIQGAALAQGPARPLLTPHQAPLPKHQGTTAQTLQLCMTPPVIAGGQQPFAVPSHIPLPQPHPAVWPVQVPSGNTIFSSKF